MDKEYSLKTIGATKILHKKIIYIRKILKDITKKMSMLYVENGLISIRTYIYYYIIAYFSFIINLLLTCEFFFNCRN